MRGWLAARGLLLMVGGAALASLALVMGDAVFDFSDEFRIIGRWLPVGVALAFATFAAFRIRRVNQHELAARFERADTTLGSRLTNAVELGARPGATAIEHYLRGEAVDLGRRAAADLKAWSVARGTVLRAAAGVACATAGWLVLLTLGGGVLTAVWPRFMDPRGDHPPFSLLKIEVHPQHAEVLFGGHIEVRATTRGRPVDKLWLVARSGTNVSRSPMFLAPDRTFFLNLASLREAVEYCVTDGPARSHWYRIELQYSPQITGLELDATFPEYTGMAPTPVVNDDKGTSLPMGTRLRVRALSNRPLQDGRLVLTPVLGGAPTEVELKPDVLTNGPAHVVSGSLTVTQSVAYALTVRDVRGLVSTEPRNGRLTARPDAKPRIFVTEPGRDAVATPQFVVPVQVQAQDDYGITRVLWLRGHNRSVERPFAMPLKMTGHPRAVEASGEFALGQLGVKPGDVIEYYFEAADNDPLGPNLALSRPYRLEIISQSQLEEILRRQAAQQALFEMYLKLDAWQRRMAERSRSLAEKASDTSPEAMAARRQEASELLENLRDFNRQREALLDTPPLFDIERAFHETLQSQQDAFRDLEKKLSEAFGGGSGMPSEALLKELAQAMTDSAEEERQNVGDPAAQIAAVVNLLAQANVFTQMAEEQAVIARQLQRFAFRSGALSRFEEMEVRELTDRQRGLQQDLQRWMDTLPKLVEALPDDDTFDPLRDQVQNFLTDVNDARIPADLSEAVNILQEPDPATGYVLAQRAAQKMDELVAKSPPSGMQTTIQECLKFQPSLSQAMGNTLQQILQATGMAPGSGGRYGYGMSSRNMGLYGSSGLMQGRQGGMGQGPGVSSPGSRNAQIPGAADGEGLPVAGETGPMRLNPDAPFPLRYRDVVGEYFRVISESEKRGGQ